VRRDARSASIVVAALLSFLAFVPAASADKVIAGSGEGAGQVKNAAGLAADSTEERLYVADRGNNRIDVFDAATGDFEMAFGWGVDTGASQFETCTAISGCNAGIAGSGTGQFNEPSEVAIDKSTHDVYVVDYGNSRVEKFDPAGNFLLAFGSPGTGPGQFSGQTVTQGRGHVTLGIGPGGTVYVGDGEFEEPNQQLIEEGFGTGKWTNRIQLFEPSGLFIKEVKLGLGSMLALAVDSTGGSYVYGAAGGGFHKFDSSFNEVASFPNGTVGALAVDPADNLFVAAGAGGISSIIEYGSSTPPAGIRRFGYRGDGLTSPFSADSGLAPYQSANGDIYASEGDQVSAVGFSAPGPVVLSRPCTAPKPGNTSATLSAQVNPEGKATTFHFQYVDQESFEAEGGFASKNTRITSESGLPGSDFELYVAKDKVGGLLPETSYRCRVIAKNEDGENTGEEGPFVTDEPFNILATWSSATGIETVTLNASVNPLEIPATAYFEYVDDASFEASGFADAQKSPELELGAGNAPKTISSALVGLKPGTGYRYRVVVDDPLVAPRNGPERTFRTFLSPASQLPDGRAYELVSPASKNSAEVAVPGSAGGLFVLEFAKIQAAAPGGEAITYTSFTAFGDAKSAPGTSQYLSKRTGGGWSTENITPPGVQANPLHPPFRGFTPDLGIAGMVVAEPPLTEDAVAGFGNLYLRDDTSGELRAITTEPPAGGNQYCVGYAGVSADGQRAIFSAGAAFVGAPEVKGSAANLYEWSASGGLKLVSVLPGGEPAKPAPGSSFGSRNDSNNCQVGLRIARHTISADGRRIFWTYAPSFSESQLLARIDGTETVQLDAIQGGTGPAGNGKFLNASADGSKVFFTASGRLTADASTGEGADLYRYDFDAPNGERLEDLTPDGLTPGPEAAKVEGLLGASEDGAYAYFVADGVLSGEQTNSEGSKAQAGKPNLYLFHEGEAPRFIATLGADSPVDSHSWSDSPKAQTARVTPDGHQLAFLSTASLTGYDNTIANGAGCLLSDEERLTGDSHCSEAYLYDADDNRLTCASCNPSGGRPLGPAALPVWSNPYEQPRYLSNDGSRLFFESLDSLDASDTNGLRDVYEFERAGSGGCSSGSAGFSAETGGCVYLISSGQSTDRSFLLDASSDGRDVFLSTRQSLLGRDDNENYDVYDARVGGGFPESSPPPPCSAEACKPPTQAPPTGFTPATPSFQGPGNQAGRPSKKHRSQKHKKNKHSHKRANQKRRAGR
jgi:DNA-binding beta-propeller fold protein YncE